MITQSNIMGREITSRTHTFSKGNGKVRLSCQSRRRQSSWHLSAVTWWWLWSVSVIINLKGTRGEMTVEQEPMVEETQ